MPTIEVPGARLFYEQTGDAGEPMVLVHGSWGDHHNWDLVVRELARTFRVVSYDRRGHSQSERPAGQGSIHEDVADLAALVERLDLAPAHLVGNSGGAAVVLRLAGERPELFRSLLVHEPPLFALLEGVPEMAPALAEVDRRIAAVVALLESGEAEAGARLFVESIAFGPGAWEGLLPHEMRRTFVFNAPTFLDECRDPGALRLDLDRLRRYRGPALLTHGTTSPPFFPAVVERIAAALPLAERATVEGAGHVPHLTHPEAYVPRVRDFALRRAVPER